MEPGKIIIYFVYKKINAKSVNNMLINLF